MAGKKVHWTKLPKNRARVRRMIKKLHLAKAKKQRIRVDLDALGAKNEKNYAIHIHSANVTPLRESPDAERSEEVHIPSYLYGHIEQIIERVAIRSGIPFTDLATGVAKLLQDTAIRQ